MGRVRKLGILLIGGVLPVMGCRATRTNEGPRIAPLSSLPVALTTSSEAPSSTSELPPTPTAIPDERPLPINLATALRLAGANPLDIVLAGERLRAADAQLQRANVMWLPTVYLGTDYFRQDGSLQASGGAVSDVSKSSFMVGATPNVVFAVTDAIYAPLAAKQVVRARQSDVRAARNDSLLSVAEAYFNVQQARGELVGAVNSAQRTEDLAKRVEKLSEILVPAAEKNRAAAELAHRRQAVDVAVEHWQSASADLNRLLRLDPTALAVPMEAPHLQVNLIDPNRPVDDLIPVAFTYRPELASHQALVQAALARIRQEKMRPLLPSVLIRGAATNPAGTLAFGDFGGGANGDLSNFGLRNTIDFQFLWEIQNLGFGNRALVHQREAENREATLLLFKAQDRIAAEVVQARAQAINAARRLHEAEEELKNAVVTVEKNLEGVQQTRSVAGSLVLVTRPQEVVAAIQSLDQAYRDYYGAIADSNRAQFRLYRALGQPAQCLVNDQCLPAFGATSPTESSSKLEAAPVSPNRTIANSPSGDYHEPTDTHWLAR
jgi:outer membrane protein TolC